MIYVLHFARPYHHARHYLGFAENEKTLERRVRQHIEGTGRRPSPLVRAVVAAGIEVTHVATFEGDRDDEKRIKTGARTAAFCPVCRAEYLRKARERMQRLRTRRRPSCAMCGGSGVFSNDMCQNEECSGCEGGRRSRARTRQDGPIADPLSEDVRTPETRS